MLQIKNLSIIHKKDLRVILNDFSCVLNDGDKAVIIGEEGNGKSTLLKWIYDEKLVDDYCETEQPHCGKKREFRRSVSLICRRNCRKKNGHYQSVSFLWKRRAFWSRHQKRWDRWRQNFMSRQISFTGSSPWKHCRVERKSRRR